MPPRYLNELSQLVFAISLQAVCCSQINDGRSVIMSTASTAHPSHVV